LTLELLIDAPTRFLGDSKEATARLTAKISKSRGSLSVGFIFWIPLAPMTTFKYKYYISRRSPPSPFDKEFAGSPVMPDIPTGMAGPFILETIA
jgi:hypothetical protein